MSVQQKGTKKPKLLPRYKVAAETVYVIYQASRRVHTVDSLALARKIARQWNSEHKHDK